jgi:conjugal transfer pilus assembly protein TraW
LVRSDSKDSAFRGIDVVRHCDGGYECTRRQVARRVFFRQPPLSKNLATKNMHPSFLTVFSQTTRVVVRARLSRAALQQKKPRTWRGFTAAAKVFTGDTYTFAATQPREERISTSFGNGNFRDCLRNDVLKRSMTDGLKPVKGTGIIFFRGKAKPVDSLSAFLRVTGTVIYAALKKILFLIGVSQTIFLQNARVVACALLLYAAVFPDASASARVVGIEGNVYPIHEIELTKLIAAKAGEFDFERYAESNKRQMEDRVRSFRPVDAVSDLPIANISAAYKIDPTYTLPYDIRDAQGEIVYPQGYTFNPLEAMSRQGLSLRTPYVIINADRPEEMRWLERKVGKSAKGTFVLLITNGHAYELSERFGFPVYYLSEQVRERLAIRVTPTVIFQPQNERKFLLANIFRLDSDGRELIPKRR